MQNKHSVVDVLKQQNDTILSSISISCVIYGFHEGTIKILLSKFKISDKWMLPSGFVLLHEDVDISACQVIKEKTGLDKFYMQQFHLFGKCSRYRAEEHYKLLKKWNIDVTDDHWSMKRLISMGYYALVKYDRVEVPEDNEFEEVAWFDMDKIPVLFSDHNEMIEKSLRLIKREIGYVPLGYELLADKFTMPDLRIIYEAFIGHELDRRNFQRKMLSIGLIRRLDEKMKKGAHKAPYLYSFNEKEYKEALNNGEQLMAWTMQ